MDHQTTDEVDAVGSSTPSPWAAYRPPNRAHLKVGGAFSCVYVLGFAVYALIEWTAFLNMTPDEFAAFLSGVFAPLAFLWLVLGFMQQGEELRQSSHALWLQGEELRSSVEQQAQLVRVSREQLEFEQERLTAEREEAQRRSQPDFKLKGGSWMQGGTLRSTLVDLVLLNRGAACSDITIYAGDSIVSKISFLAFGGEEIFRIGLSDDVSKGPYPMRVQYRDGRGDDGEVTLGPMVVKDTAGHPFLELP